MAKIAVEDSLTQVKQALQSSGHQVVSMNNAQNCECCVISGQDKNVMGITASTSRTPVINAEGMTAQEVVSQVENSITKLY